MTLYVGEDKTPFYVHEDLLCEVSSVFKAAFGPNWHSKQGFERKMDLPEEEVNTFEDFVDWLYTREYGIPGHDLHNFQEQYNERTGDAMYLFVIADKYDVPELKHKICDQMIELARDRQKQPPALVVSYAYSRLPEKSAMRKLLADWYASTLSDELCNQSVFREWLSKNPDIAVDLIAALTKRANYSGNFYKLKAQFWGPNEDYYDQPGIETSLTLTEAGICYDLDEAQQ